MTDCQKYQMFVEDNYMLEFMIWEDKILPMNEKKPKLREIDDPSYDY